MNAIKHVKNHAEHREVSCSQNRFCLQNSTVIFTDIESREHYVQPYDDDDHCSLVILQRNMKFQQSLIIGASILT